MTMSNKRHMKLNPTSQKTIRRCRAIICELRQELSTALWGHSQQKRFEIAESYARRIQGLYQIMNGHIDPSIMNWGDFSDYRPSDLTNQTRFVRSFNNRVYD